MRPLKENQPLIWTVLAGLATALIAFLVPGLRRLLGIVPLAPAQWGLVAGIALLLLAIVELGKLIAQRLQAQD